MKDGKEVQREGKGNPASDLRLPESGGLDSLLYGYFSLDNGHKYFIKKVENGYRYKWVSPDIYVAMKDNSPLLFIDSLEKLNGGYTGGAF